MKFSAGFLFNFGLEKRALQILVRQGTDFHFREHPEIIQERLARAGPAQEQ